MVIFIKKIKTKEGINSLNLDKVKKDIPAEFQLIDLEPVITFTANHVLVAYKVKLAAVKKEAVAKKAAAIKPKAPARKKNVAAKG